MTVSDIELAALIAGLTGEPAPEPTEAQAIELLANKLGAVPVEEVGTAPAAGTAPATVGRPQVPVRDAQVAKCEGEGCGEIMFAAAAKYRLCPTCALKGSGDDLFGPASAPATQTAPVPAAAPTPAATTPPEPVPGPTTEPVNWDPPISTVEELRPVLVAYDASRPRSMQVRLGPSELGTPCQQQIARKLAGAPRRPITDPAWAPFQGTAVHAEMEKVVAFWNGQLGRTRWLAEDDLQIDDEIHGHGDAFDLDHDLVADWKHVGTTALKKLRAARRAGRTPAEQVSSEYRVQGHLYGVGHERKGRTVRWVRLVLLARSWQFSDSDEWTEAYQPEIAYTALDRYYATQDLLRALDVERNRDLIAAVPATPSPDACKWCPFNRPGQPSDWGGCQGDVATAEKAAERFAEGLLIPS